MTFSEYIDKTRRRDYRNNFPVFFNEFQSDLKNHEINVICEDNTINLEYYKKDILKNKLTLEDYLDSILGSFIENVNDNILSHYNTNNMFINELPLFVIRRHGSYSGEIGSKKRRRGWLVKFNNAWIVYADNFFPRHFFESTYFVDMVTNDEFRNLNLELRMPYSSGGGKFEKKHRIFPALTHLSSNSNIYLSHLDDLNQSIYKIGGIEISAKSILGNNSDNKFGFGKIENWDGGKTIFEERNYRIIDDTLSNQELEFLKAYNIRMLSPFNYFPFPKNTFLKNGSVNGEDQNLRNLVKVYLEKKHGNSYKNFKELAGINI